MNLSYFSSTPGIGGQLKTTSEDFAVEEITKNGTIFEIDKDVKTDNKESESKGEFLHFVLQKDNWATADAIKEIAKALHTTPKRFNFAGTKDKKALTTQLVSCFGLEREKLDNIKIKDITILGSWYAREKIDLGDLLGNRFKIRVEGADKNSDKIVSKIYKELDGKFPNYFGEQRFGSTRKNTHIIGEKILKRQFKEAVLDFLCNSEGEENKEASLARKELADTFDYTQALKNFPHYLRLERTVIAELEKNSNGYINALKQLPRPTLLMFVHAFQSHLFNRMLSHRIENGVVKIETEEYYCKENKYGFPDINQKSESKTDWIAGKLIGYDNVLNAEEKAMLKEFNISQEDFKIRSIPEINSKGGFRTLFAPLKDFAFDSKNNVFAFSLQSGSYATTALREFINQKPKRND
ncbi:MAG: tRNA pseudouridine(13) synthase TruD [Candidatus Micrarchaeota archaeon]